MRRTQERFTFTMVNQLVVTAGNDFRSVDLRPREGLVAASEGVRGGKALDWRTSVYSAHTLLSAVGEWCTYGHLTPGAGTMSASTLTPEGDRRVGNPWASGVRDWAELVTGGGFIDAYAIMRLPISDRAQVHAQWQITDLPVGSILATHPDQAAWFSQPRVNAAALDIARRSLGSSLMTVLRRGSMANLRAIVVVPEGVGEDDQLVHRQLFDAGMRLRDKSVQG